MGHMSIIPKPDYNIVLYKKNPPLRKVCFVRYFFSVISGKAKWGTKITGKISGL